MTRKKSSAKTTADKTEEKTEATKDERRVDTEAPNLDAQPLAASPANGGPPTPDAQRSE